eukprot:4245412-Amphidinium_carterae.1
MSLILWCMLPGGSKMRNSWMRSSGNGGICCRGWCRFQRHLHELLRQPDIRGADVSLQTASLTGVVDQRFPYPSFRWQFGEGFRFQVPQHINVLELYEVPKQVGCSALQCG